MAQLRLNFLGSFEAHLGGQPLRAFQSNKVRALLAYLAVKSDRAHSREHLTSLFWPEQPEGRARADLSQAVYNLRKILGEQSLKKPSRKADETAEFILDCGAKYLTAQSPCQHLGRCEVL